MLDLLSGIGIIAFAISGAIVANEERWPVFTGVFEDLVDEPQLCRARLSEDEGVESSFERQPERSHLFAVANEQHVADEDGMVPRLAVDRLEPADLGEPVDGCRDERDVPFLG